MAQKEGVKFLLVFGNPNRYTRSGTTLPNLANTTMIAKKVLTLVNDVIGPIVIPRDHFVQSGVQYGAGGLGTIVLEGTLDGTTFVAIPMSADGGVTFVLLAAAAGIWQADVSVYSSIQLRKSVAGAGAVTASLSIAS